MRIIGEDEDGEGDLGGDCGEWGGEAGLGVFGGGEVAVGSMVEEMSSEGSEDVS